MRIDLFRCQRKQPLLPIGLKRFPQRRKYGGFGLTLGRFPAELPCRCQPYFHAHLSQDRHGCQESTCAAICSSSVRAASLNVVESLTIIRLAPASANLCSVSRSLAWPKTVMSMVLGSRPAAAASASKVARPILTSSGVTRIGSQPSPQAITRCKTLRAAPPKRTGGWGCCDGFGNDRTGGKS